MIPTIISPTMIFLKGSGTYFNSKYETNIENSKNPMIMGISSNILFFQLQINLSIKFKSVTEESI